jgi:hypothetical protein
MIKDPLFEWPSLFPYDAFVPAGMTPDSTMRQILDAQYTLVDLGLWNPEARSHWSELRNLEQRLWLDLFLYPISATEVVAALDEIGQPLCGRGQEAANG